MFIVDARMSFAVLAVIALSAVILRLDDGSGLLEGMVLVLGSLGVLFRGVLAAAKSISGERTRDHM